MARERTNGSNTTIAQRAANVFNDVSARSCLFLLVVFFMVVAFFMETPNLTLGKREGGEKILFNSIRQGFASNKMQNAEIVSGESTPTVALLFAPVNELFNEPVWRAFFEAAGLLSFRFEPPQRPYNSFVRGEGKKLFDIIRNEDVQRSLKEDTQEQHATACQRETRVLDREVQRLLSGKDSDRDVISKQNLFTVYTHPTAGYYYPETSIFYGTEIFGRLNTTGEWATYKVVRVEIKLLQSALAEKRNQKFILLSESCIPLYRPEVIYLQLLSETKSRVNACDHMDTSNTERWEDGLATDHLKKENWRKSDQWFGLKRSHAELLVEDTHLGPKFEEYCTPQGHFCVPDEHYIAIMLAMYKLENETDCIGHVTKWIRPFPGMSHPLSFAPQDINFTLFETLRNSPQCDRMEAQVSTQSVFLDQYLNDRCREYEITDMDFVHPDDTDDWIVDSGYHQLNYTCPIFARKFPRESLMRTVTVALQCDGGALGYWC